jgi:DNA repair ATPase RecN
MSKMINLRKKLEDIMAETRRVSVEFGGMSHIPKYAPSFSSAKLDSLDKDLEKLHAHEDKTRAEIAELQNSPAFIAEQDEKLNNLAGKRNKLDEQLTKTRAEYDHKRYGEADAVLSGVDPLQLSIEIFELKETISRLEEAIGIINSGVRSVEALSTLQFSSRAGVALVDTPVDQGQLVWPS